MELIHLNKIDTDNLKLSNSIKQFNKLIDLLNERKLPVNIVEKINADTTAINDCQFVGISLFQFIKKKQNNIIKLTEKELKLVPKNYYRNLWMILGTSAFGLPIGVVFGLSTNNMSLLGVGLPIGMGIGLLVGILLDKKALHNGKQLDIELN